MEQLIKKGQNVIIVRLWSLLLPPSTVPLLCGHMGGNVDRVLCMMSKLKRVKLRLIEIMLVGLWVFISLIKKRCDLACVRMIIMDELPFSHVEGEGFRAFVQELQPEWTKMNRKAIAKGVWELYQFEKAKLTSQFSSHATKVSITTDTWTSIQNVNYMAVTAHFLDNDWILHKRIINFVSIISHKGEDIGRLLEVCLRQWGVKHVFTITVDNASANDSAVEYMRRRLKQQKTLSFDGAYMHLRCACYIINLVVKDGIKEIKYGVEAIWHCVKYFRSSSSRLDKFREFSVLENLSKIANVPLDVVTRWNNTYFMLDAALKYEKVFDRMADEDDQFRKYFESRVGPPKEEDWRNAEAFVHFLSKFYEATLKLSAWKNVTSHIMFAELVGLQTEIDVKIKDASDPILQKCAASMKLKFDKYWGTFDKLNKIVVIANVLDPRWKLQYQKIDFAMVKVVPFNEEGVSITNQLKTILMMMYEEYKVANPSSLQEDEECQLMVGIELEGIMGTQAQILAAIAKERLEAQAEMISNEVDKYLSDKYVNPNFPGFDIAQWWRQNQNVYPILSKLGKDIFAIPCSTVASENAFNLGKRVVDPYRSSLTPQMVECLVCSSDWLRATQPNFYKEPTKDGLDLCMELEELQKETAGISLNDPSSSSIN